MTAPCSAIMSTSSGAEHSDQPHAHHVQCSGELWAHLGEARQLSEGGLVDTAVQVLDAQHAQAGEAADGGQRALAHAEEVVAVLDLQLAQCCAQHAQHHAEVGHAEVVLLLQVDKVALICAVTHWHQCTSLSIIVGKTCEQERVTRSASSVWLDIARLALVQLLCI